MLRSLVGSEMCIRDRISAAAIALSENVSAEELESGLLYPAVSRLQHVSEKVAEAVLLQAKEEGLTDIGSADAIRKAIDAARWTPLYSDYVAS